jgi:hypothetical protein
MSDEKPRVPFDLSSLPLCGARTRGGLPCRHPGKKANGRCRRHGGLSTGPKTAAGIERIRRARTTHGQQSAKTKAERAELRLLFTQCRELLDQLEKRPYQKGSEKNEKSARQTGDLSHEE